MALEFVAPAGRSYTVQDQQIISQLSDLKWTVLRALLEYRSIFDINVKQMDFLVGLSNGSLIIDPNQ